MLNSCIEFYLPPCAIIVTLHRKVKIKRLSTAHQLIQMLPTHSKNKSTITEAQQNEQAKQKKQA
jgi:hypothetical protein